MVKIKGFTLIELMIVIAIIGILASMVVGPIRDRQTSNPNDASVDNDSDINNTTVTVINGVRHKCSVDGDCEPID